MGMCMLRDTPVLRHMRMCRYMGASRCTDMFHGHAARLQGVEPHKSDTLCVKHLQAGRRRGYDRRLALGPRPQPLVACPSVHSAQKSAVVILVRRRAT
jgi:hypothetical protein